LPERGDKATLGPLIEALLALISMGVQRPTAPRLTGAHAALRIPDATLVEKVNAGEWESFHAIYDRYASRVYGLCTQAAGERPAGRVLVKEVFLLAKKHLRKLKDPMRLRDWLQAITIEVIRVHRLGGKKGDVLPVEPERLRVEGDDEFLPLLRELKAALVSRVVGTAQDPKVRAVLEAYYRAPAAPSPEELGQAAGCSAAEATAIVERTSVQINRSLMATLALLDGPIDEPPSAGAAAGPAGDVCPLADPAALDHLCEGKLSRRELDVVAAHLSLPAAPASRCCRDG
jgi:DNA-directed RNA polymerase specialized sigma24 family protein